jgi:uncharacterized protein YjbI with pentapeptide repeats
MRIILSILSFFIFFNNFLVANHQIIHFSNQQDWDSQIVEILNQADEIDSLTLSTIHPADPSTVDFSALTHFKNLKSIEMIDPTHSRRTRSWENFFNEEVLETFPFLPNLERIKIGDGCIKKSDRTLQNDFVPFLLNWLTKFENLKSIDLSYNFILGNVFIKDETYNFSVLQNLKNLEELNLSSTAKGIRYNLTLSGLEEVKNIKILHFADNDFSENESVQKDVAFIFSLDHLKEINLANTTLFGRCAIDLKAHFSLILPELKKLNLSTSFIKSLDWAQFVPNLEWLDISFMKFETFDLRTLGGFDKLKYLGLCRTYFTKDNLWELQSTPPLVDLEEIDLSFATIKGIDFCFAPNLKKLNLRESNISNGDLKSIPKLLNLEYLDVSKTKVTGSGLKKLEKLTQLKTVRLTSLDLTDANFENLIQLENLDLSMSELSYDSFESLKFLQSLKTLNLRFIKSKHVNEQEILELQSSMPDCVITY